MIPNTRQYNLIKTVKMLTFIISSILMKANEDRQVYCQIYQILGQDSDIIYTTFSRL